jgi:hypothetical protein
MILNDTNYQKSDRIADTFRIELNPNTSAEALVLHGTIVSYLKNKASNSLA